MGQGEKGGHTRTHTQLHTHSHTHIQSHTAIHTNTQSHTRSHVQPHTITHQGQAGEELEDSRTSPTQTPDDPQKPPELQPGELRSRHYRLPPPPAVCPAQRTRGGGLLQRPRPVEASARDSDKEVRQGPPCCSCCRAHALIPSSPALPPGPPSALPPLPCPQGRPHPFLPCPAPASPLPGFSPKPHIWSLCLRLCFQGTWPKTFTSQLQLFLKTGVIRLIPQGCSDNERRFADHLTWGLPGVE